MNKDIVVSVCMITYNHEKFIREAIEGVLMQKTNFPIELVIGEDCSTDNTREIVMEYAGKHPELIRLSLPKKNLGIKENFIKTIQACTGKYIALCEGDDYWIDPYKLQMQVDFLEENEEFVLSHTNGYRNIKGKQIPWKEYYPNQGNIKEVFYYGTVIKTCSVVLRSLYIREFNLMFSKTDLLIGDWPLFAYYSTKGKIGYISDKTCVYRDNPNSVSSVKSAKSYIKYSLSLINVKRFLRDKIFVNELDTIYSEDNLQLDTNYALLKFYFDTYNYYELKKFKKEPLNQKSKRLTKYTSNYILFILACIYRKITRKLKTKNSK